MTILYAMLVYNLINLDSVSQTSSRTVARQNICFASQEFPRTSDTPHLGTKASIQKLDETKDLDVSTTLTEHFKTLYLVLYAPGCVKTLPTILGHQRLNSLKVSCDIVKNSTDFFLKKKTAFLLQ